MSTTTDTQTSVRYDKDADNIVTLTLDDPNQSANTMNDLYISSMKAAVDRLEDELAADPDAVAGVVIASAKKTFFAGGDLKGMVQAGPDDAASVFAMSENVKAALRRLELLPKPVVAAINGAALGGGFEICLAAQHRIAVDDPKVTVGLPESSLGLLPGGGGVTRMVRKFGLQAGLMDFLLTGAQFKAGAAKEKGLVDELVATQDELVPAAKAWIKANPEATQNPWDAPGYKMPGGNPKSPALASFLPAFPALLRKQTKGAVYPAARAILSAAVEGASRDFDTASRIESRYLTNLIVNQGSKNMIQAFFFDLQAINAGTERPQGIEPYRAVKVGVLGAGMMGAGIAYSCARAGMEVVLKDVSQENADKGKAYSEKLNAKGVSRGKLTEEKSAEMLGRITPTADPADLTGCDLVIEAVFEDPALKAKVFAEIMPFVNDDALLCSNTSTLPITELAQGVDRPADFIGLHFSPVDKMPLVEIIKGKETLRRRSPWPSASSSRSRRPAARPRGVGRLVPGLTRRLRTEQANGTCPLRGGQVPFVASRGAGSIEDSRRQGVKTTLTMPSSLSRNDAYACGASDSGNRWVANDSVPKGSLSSTRSGRMSSVQRRTLA